MQENADAVRRLYEAFNRRDTAATRELMDPEIEYVNPEDAVERGTRKGFDQRPFRVVHGPQRALEMMEDTSSGTPSG